MKDRMSEGFVPFTSKDFGQALVKAEGSSIQFNTGAVEIMPCAETYWFEQPFTKEEFAKLAATCKAKAEDKFLQKVGKWFAECAEHGYVTSYEE